MGARHYKSPVAAQVKQNALNQRLISISMMAGMEPEAC
jgi:hypothetical protein